METAAKNDSPTADSIAYLEAQGVATDDEDEDDIHFCKKCKQVFNKIEAYLEHKVKHDKFKVAYNRAPGDRRMVLPTLMKKELPTLTKKEPVEKATEDSQEQTGDSSHRETDAPVKTRKRRKKKSPAVDIQLIAERNTYICTKCDRKFSREATLKWHLEYDHKADRGSEEEEEEEAGQEEEEGDRSYVARREPVLRRQKMDNSGGGERPFKCDVCGLGFKEVAVLKAHMLTHSNVRQYKCSYENCPYAFKTKGSLVRHTRRHTGERPYMCEICNRKFAESGALTRHMRSRNPCSAKSDSDLPRYGKKWTYVPNIPAVVSGEQGGEEGGLVSMVPGEVVMVVTEGENGEQILTEAQVVSNTETVSSLGETLMEEGEVAESEVGELVAASSMENLTPTQCKVCKEECLVVEALRVHLRLHLADCPFHCGLCHFITEHREELRAHIQSKHIRQLNGKDPSSLLPPDSSGGSKENAHHSSGNNADAETAVKQLLELPSFPGSEDGLTETLSTRVISRCPVCNRAFRGNSYLKQHMKSHTGDRPHECPVCHKGFVTKDALNKHLIVHTDERNFKCGECGKLFKRIGHVREHLKIHVAERPFPCTVCDKSFKTNNALKVHVRTHTDFYPYECRTCHRQFREKGSLQRHLRTHTGERPYRCPRCGRGFAEHGTLNRHLKAKVQCPCHLGYQAVEQDVEEGMEVVEAREEGEEGAQGEGDVPTVLAQFSNVVADTQHYMVADGEGETQTTEYVVLHSDLASGDIQNVEIVTDGDIDPDAILSTVAGADNSYVVISEAGNQLRILDTSTGLTLATVPATSDQLALLPSCQAEESDHVTSDATSTALTVTLGEPSVSMGDGVGSAAMVTTSEGVVGGETITVHTEGGVVTVVGGEGLADTVKQAMMAGNIVETGEEGEQVDGAVTVDQVDQHIVLSQADGTADIDTQAMEIQQ